MHDDIEGIVTGACCMECLDPFIDETGTCHEFGYPLLCELCWDSLSLKDRNSGVPFFDTETGEVHTGE
jgi:hypothetical protein